MPNASGQRASSAFGGRIGRGTGGPRHQQGRQVRRLCRCVAHRQFDTFVDGAKAGKFDTFTDGARAGQFDPFDWTAPRPGKFDTVHRWRARRSVAKSLPVRWTVRAPATERCAATRSDRASCYQSGHLSVGRL
ncbi:hypothetical protein ACU4GD_29550 [Cupriavidus basilensis]